jgi:hypothetical protein
LQTNSKSTFVLLTFILKIALSELYGQLPLIPVGSWRSHFDYNKGVAFAEAGNIIFMAAQNGLFQYDINEQEAKILNSSDGFYELNISKMAFDNTTKQLVIAYKSGAIDLVKLDNDFEIASFTSILSIKNSTTIIDTKNINDIIIKGNIAYLSADFGIVQIDLQKKQIKEIDQNLSPDGKASKIYSVEFLNEKILALTDDFLIEANINDNLKNFNNWKYIEKPKDTKGIQQNLVVNKGQILVSFSFKGLYQFEGKNFMQLAVLEEEIYCATSSETTVYLGAANKIFTYNLTNNTSKIITEKLIKQPLQIAIDDQKIWLADFENGLVSNVSGGFQRYNPKESPGLISIRNDSVVTDQTKLIYRKLGNGNGLEISNEAGRKRIFSTIPLNSADGRFTSATINSIAVDKNNAIVLATNGGIVFLNSTEELLEVPNLNEFISTPTINGQRVLKDELVLSVAVDGGNRKWVGTSTALYLFNDELNEIFEKFTNVNSPLPSNYINFLNLEPTNGELFIYTPNGIVSYRTNSSESVDNQSDNVLVFPNPVRPDFDGVVAISGLVQNAILKITDVAGNLVYKTKANGGTATWNLNGSNGQRVESGIYFLFSSNEFGKENLVSKLAIIK